MEDPNGSSEKKEVEEYLKQYCMEECLDEILNEVILERPTNPYVAMALLCESKTLPEIIDVNFQSILIGGELAVQANFTTNITTFIGVATYNSINPDEPKTFRDYSMLREKIRDSILDIDPTNMAKVDESIAKLSGIDPAESLALSIACCRAGARHKGLKLYKYIAQMVGLKEEEICIPTPVISVASRIIEGTQATQDITLTSVKASTFSNALEILLQVANKISKSEIAMKPKVMSIWGSPCVNTPNISTASKHISDILVEMDLHHEVKQGLHARAEYLLKQPIDPVEPEYFYLLDDTAGAARTGGEVVDTYTALWQEVELITLDEGVYGQDAAALMTMHKRVQETTYDLKAANGNTMKYCMSGVGGDSTCSLQIPIEGSVFAQIDNIEQFSSEMPYNTLKIQLSSYSNLSQILEIMKKVRTMKWPVMIISNNTPEYGNDSNDTFISDFSIGIGATQLLVGSIYTTECVSKYNRIMEILHENPNIRYIGNHFRGK